MKIKKIIHHVRYFIVLFIKYFSLGVGLLIFIILKILQPLLYIRIGHLHGYARIGELAASTELYLRRLTQSKINSCEFHIFFSGEPANHQLLKMIRRKIPVIQSQFIVGWYTYLRAFIGNSDLWLDMPSFHNYPEEFDTISPQLHFNNEEEELGRALLKKINIKPGMPFVCFHIRDKSYLDAMYPNQNWTYHDYRNCSLDNYLPAIKYLASLGIFTIRMGHVVEKKLVSNNPHIIDYATHFRSDFGDIYLSAKCKFFLASEGGLGNIPWIFNVPVAYSNGAPSMGVSAWRSPDVFIFKKLWSYEKKRLLTFREIIQMQADKWFHTDQYKEAKIEILENTSEEIVSLVKELNARLDKNWITTEEEKDLQKKYREIIPNHHRCYNAKSRICTDFLRQNQDLLI